MFLTTVQLIESYEKSPGDSTVVAALIARLRAVDRVTDERVVHAGRVYLVEHRGELVVWDLISACRIDDNPDLYPIGE